MSDLSDMQGIVRTGYGDLLHSVMCVLTFSAPERFAELIKVLPLHTAADPATQQVASVALTQAGLRFLGLDDEAFDTFAPEFVLGMHNDTYAQHIGDTDAADKPASWRWGDADTHAVVFCYADHPSTGLPSYLAGFQGEVSYLLPTQWRGVDASGFSDGLSNPHPLGSASRAPDSALGEYVLGYPDSHGSVEQVPYVRADLDRSHVLLPAEPYYGETAPQKSLGLNGSYMVVRQLEEHPNDFHNYANSVGAGLGESADWVQEKIMGRRKKGMHLVPDVAPDDELSFVPRDSVGQHCPVGSHIRRAHPRDSLGESAAESIRDAAHHRILRRGRQYQDDDGMRGTLFVCLQASIGRQFEHVLKTWLRNRKFSPNGEEQDPLTASSAGTQFALVRDGVARRLDPAPKLTTMRGGALLFLPSLRCLHFLARLNDLKGNE